MTIREQLTLHLAEFSSLPFLFVGSGLSRRYLGVEDWDGLLRRFSGHLDRDYEYYLSSADGNLPHTASLIADAFHHHWWNDDAFKESRLANSRIAINSQSALKIEIAGYLSQLEVDEPPNENLKSELDTLRQAVVDGVITTNWDLLLESIFPEYKVFVGQDELLFSSPQGIAEIYKIHGSCIAPNSLILTDRDYAGFQQRNAYLAAKLLTIFVEHPVIFLGYSLRDPNILSILDEIAACVSEERIHELRNRLIFVVWDSSEAEGKFSSSSLVLRDTPLPVVEIRTASLLPVFKVLAGLQRRFSPKLLRQLKEQVYDLVRTQDKLQKLYVQDIDEEVETENIEVVLGVGVIDAIADRGYTPISREMVARDVLFNEESWSADRIVRDVLPQLLKQSRIVPVFKYLRAAGMLDSSGELVVTDLDPRVIRASERTIEDLRVRQYGKRREQEIFENGYGIADIERVFDAEEVLKYGALVDESRLSSDELRAFLRANWDFFEHRDSARRTNFRRLVCIYDILVNSGR